MSIVSNVRREDWEQGLNPEGAVASARALFEAVADGSVDPVANIEILEIAAEPLWDGPEGDPLLVMRVARDMQGAFARTERQWLDDGSMEFNDPARVALRVRPMMLLARAQYRVEGQAREAFSTLLALWTWIEGFAEGNQALRRILRHDANPVAEATVALLGLWPAVLRKAGLPRSLHEQYRKVIMNLIAAYMGRDGPRVIYARTPALAIQGFKLGVEDRRAGERGLVRLLYELDVRTRPQHARGQSTRAVRDAAWSAYCEDEVGFTRNRKAADAEIAAFGLPRHQTLIERYGYLAA